MGSNLTRQKEQDKIVKMSLETYKMPLVKYIMLWYILNQPPRKIIIILSVKTQPDIFEIWNWKPRGLTNFWFLCKVSTQQVAKRLINLHKELYKNLGRLHHTTVFVSLSRNKICISVNLTTWLSSVSDWDNNFTT